MNSVPRLVGPRNLMPRTRSMRGSLGPSRFATPASPRSSRCAPEALGERFLSVRADLALGRFFKACKRASDQPGDVHLGDAHARGDLRLSHVLLEAHSEDLAFALRQVA